METLIPTESVIRKIIELVGHGLPAGLGEQEPGKMCVEACVNAAFGLPHNDDQPCVHRAVRAAKIVLNDSHWSDNQARGKGMLKLAVAQVGSENIDGLKFAQILFEALPGLRKRHPVRDDAEAGRYAKLFMDYIESAAYELEFAVKDEHHEAGAVNFSAWVVRIISNTCNDTDACLRDFANIMLDALRECDAPGIKWLELIPDEQ